MYTNPSQFSQFIEHQAKTNKITRTDAILNYCTENSLEPKEIKPLVNKSLKDKLEVEMQEMNLLPRNKRLKH